MALVIIFFLSHPTKHPLSFRFYLQQQQQSTIVENSLGNHHCLLRDQNWKGCFIRHIHHHTTHTHAHSLLVIGPREKRRGGRQNGRPQRGRQFDRHSGTGIAWVYFMTSNHASSHHWQIDNSDSEKKEKQGWGHPETAEAEA